MHSSVHHFTRGLLVSLRHPACVVLWHLPSRHVVTNNRCSLVKLPLPQDYTVVHYSSHYVALSLLWQDKIVCTAAWRLLYFRLFARLYGVYYIFRSWGCYNPALGIGDRVAYLLTFKLGDLG